MSIPVPTNPRMIDLVLSELQAKIKAGLTWLDYSCGKVVEIKHGGKSIPAIYIGSEYKYVMPDDTLGNYCFFDIAPKYTFAKWSKGSHALIRARYGLVFWFNIAKIYPDSAAVETEAIKEEILTLLTEKISIVNGSYTIEGISEGARDVFAQYMQEGYQEKYLLYPYGAVRFEGQLTFTSRIKNIPAV